MSEFVSETMREVTPSLADGHYEIVETIRPGRLYLAERSGKRFILKTSSGAKGVEMLKREYVLSIGLSHPYLAYVFTWEENTPVGPCIVQEFVEGDTLDKWLAGKPSLNERKKAFGELLSVVEYLHGKSIIHNDLTPANILISKSTGTLRLIDLGFADHESLLQKGIGGTRGYASPELVAGGRVDVRSDIFSLGALMRDFFPGRYRPLVRRCLQADPDRRFRSTAELTRAWRWYYRPLWLVWAAAALAALVVWTMTPTALDRAKAEVDRWYETEVPAFREALKAASSTDEAAAAMNELVGRMEYINSDLPASVPEKDRPAFHAYLFERYNSDFAPLQNELVSRVQELVN